VLSQNSWSTRRRMLARRITESAAIPASRRFGVVECFTPWASSMTLLATARMVSLSLPARESSTYLPSRCLVLSGGGSVSPSRRCRVRSYTVRLSAQGRDAPVTHVAVVLRGRCCPEAVL
jgi:hypothetical protein